MSHKITVLRVQRHREFLAGQRQDPVTRRVFAVGDRVTLCANCLLPFLEESWEAIGGTHCGQSATTGPEAFETAVEAPAVEGGAEPNAAGAGHGSDGRSDVAAPDAAPGLRPMPIKLSEVPVKLR